MFNRIRKSSRSEIFGCLVEGEIPALKLFSLLTSADLNDHKKGKLTWVVRLLSASCRMVVVVNVVLVFVVMMVVVVMVVMILVVMVALVVVVLVIVVLVIVTLQLRIFASEKARQSNVTRAFDFGELKDCGSGDGAESYFSGDVSVGGGVGGDDSDC